MTELTNESPYSAHDHIRDPLQKEVYGHYLDDKDDKFSVACQRLTLSQAKELAKAITGNFAASSTAVEMDVTGEYDPNELAATARDDDRFRSEANKLSGDGDIERLALLLDERNRTNNDVADSHFSQFEHMSWLAGAARQRTAEFWKKASEQVEKDKKAGNYLLTESFLAGADKLSKKASMLSNLGSVILKSHIDAQKGKVN